MSLYDEALVLVDGSATLGPTTDTAPTSTTRDATSGAVVVDLAAGGSGATVTGQETSGRTYIGTGQGGISSRALGSGKGVAHLCASLVLPSIPTDYADTLAVYIEQADTPTGSPWERIASFPTLYAYTRVLSVLVVTAFVAGDIGKTLLGGTTGDQGVIRWMHPDLYTIGNTANMIIAMAAADDLFDDVDEAVDATAGTGDGTMNGASVVPEFPTLGGPNTYIRAFSATKRYIRGNLTASTGSSWGAVQLLLTPYPK